MKDIKKQLKERFEAFRKLNHLEYTVLLNHKELCLIYDLLTNGETISQMHKEEIEESYYDLEFSMVMSRQAKMPYVALKKKTAGKIFILLKELKEKGCVDDGR